MKIKVLPDETYEVLSKSKPEIGVEYNLEKASEGTAEQNRAFHSLLQEYYKTGLWSYQGSGYNQGATMEEFKKMIKRKLGAGFESYIYVDFVEGMPKLFEVVKYEDIPSHVRQDQDRANYIRGRLLSWSDYTKEQRRKTMDNLISEMHQVGVNTPKFTEILEGMEK
jgi:hypothetical protein